MHRVRLVLTDVAAILAFILALVCAAASVLGYGGAYRVKLDLLTHFAPFWLAGGFAASAMSFFLPRRRSRTFTAVLALIAVVAAGGLMAPEYLRPMSPTAPADAPRQLKIVQFNAWGFRGPRDLDVQWIAAQNPDVIVIEEASPQVRDAFLAVRPYYVTCRECTVMILSLKAPTTTRIERPKHWWRRPWAPTARASFPAPGGSFDVVGVHYTWPTTSDQAGQGRALAGVLDQLPRKRVILTGDFNSTPWSFARRREDKLFGIERRTRALFSWPANKFSRYRIRFPFPFLPIDHIYAGSDWRTVSIERGPALGSDHYPVVAVLALENADATGPRPHTNPPHPGGGRDPS